MSETISVRFDVLHAYAEKNRLDFNDLCRTVRDAIAEGSALASPTAGTPAPAVPTDEQIDAAVEAYLPRAGDELRRVLTFTRWKDGIDCDYVNHRAREFVRAMLAALSAAPAAPAPLAELAGAAKVLVDFARTAPGRLPSRVQEAISAIEREVRSTSPSVQVPSAGTAAALSDAEIVDLAKRHGAFSAGDQRGFILWEHMGDSRAGLVAFARALLAQTQTKGGTAE